MTIVLLICGNLLGGFLTASLNQLIFHIKSTNYSSDRELAFVICFLFWPLALVFDLFYLTAIRGFYNWMNFLDDIPARMTRRKLKKLQAQKPKIEV